MQQVIAGLVSIALPLLACSVGAIGSDADPNTSEPVGNDEYVVYSTIISERVARRKAPVVWIVNKTQTESLDGFFGLKAAYPKAIPWTLSERVDHITERLRTLSRSTVDDYLSKNLEAAPLVRRLHFPAAYRLVDPVYEGERHRSLYRGHKVSELLALSRVGFDPLKNQALVFMSASGGTDGADTYFLLRRTRSTWDIVDSVECH